MSTATENWYPNMPPESPITGGGNVNVTSGTGAPSNDDGENGDVYINISTGDIYTKSGDVWNISGGSGTNNKSGAGSPVGVETPDYVGQGYTDTVAPYHQWQSIGLTNADWFQIV